MNNIQSKQFPTTHTKSNQVLWKEIDDEQSSQLIGGGQNDHRYTNWTYVEGKGWYRYDHVEGTCEPPRS